MRFMSFGDLNDEQLAQLRSIYEGSFPDHQRVGFGELTSPANDSDRIQLAGVVGDELVGFAALSWLPSSSWWFLEYIAVAPQVRDRGIGTRLWLFPRFDLSGFPRLHGAREQGPARIAQRSFAKYAKTKLR